MSKQPSERALKIWQLCSNCQYLEDELPECGRIRAAEWECERYACDQAGLPTKVESTVSDDTATIEHVLEELERPQSELIYGSTREQLVEVVAKIMRFER